ncbi:MAG: PAS domain S-box protein [Chloroflexi bacterium]|nr:PAS domain S-box protein [Chloroflexota bacterium]
MKILLIEDNPGDARLVREMLREGPTDFTLHSARNLESGLRFLAARDSAINVVLLDLGLPDSRGLETLATLRRHARDLPVVVMTSLDDEEQAIHAVRQGAEDYLVKGQVDGRLLRRCLLYAIERKRLTESMEKARQSVAESEERYRLIVDTAGEGIWVTSPDTRTVLVNQRMADMLGHSVEEMKGKSFFDFVAREQVPALREKQKDRMRGISEQYELQIRRKDGSLLWVMVSGSPLFDPENQYIGQLGMLTDISERKRIEEIKDEFIGMVSHELKTPLTVVMGCLYTLLSNKLAPEDRRQMLDDAIFGAESLSDILENLLELSRSQAQRMVLEKHTTAIGHVASEVVERLRSKSAIHRLVTDIPDDLSPVEIDRVRVGRLLTNLVDNAIKYSPDGGEIKIRARQDNGNLTVAVIDHGIGISKENQAKIFDRFQRLSKSGESGIPGIGLGLHVCRLLVQAHGGRIWVESEPGSGSTFYFTLPVRSEPASNR